MTTYRLYPANPVVGFNAYSGPFEAGINFKVTSGGMWFNGWYWYVPAGGDTAAQGFALWCLTGTGAGTIVPGTFTTSGALTAGTWNFVPLAVPVPISIGASYCACTGWTAVNGFPSNNNQFGAAQPFAAGITNGPLFAWSDTGGSAAEQWGNPQGVFSVSGTNVATSFPSGGSNSANFGMDVQVGTVAPAGYSGPYRLWPNNFAANPATSLDSALNYNIGTEYRTSAAGKFTQIWCYSKSGAFSLPTRAAVWSISGASEAAVNAAPSWLLPAGGAASPGAGWIYCVMPAPPVLPAGSYRVAVYNGGGTGGQWGSTDNATDYWSGGAGGGGIAWGPVLAPKLSAASTCFNYNAADGGATPPFSDGTTVPGQPPFGQLPGGGDTFPQLWANTGVGAGSQNYWVDAVFQPSGVSLPSYLVVPGGQRFAPAAGQWPLAGGTVGGDAGWYPA